jgi:hypothetical protein
MQIAKMSVILLSIFVIKRQVYASNKSVVKIKNASSILKLAKMATARVRHVFQIKTALVILVAMARVYVSSK